MKKIIIVLILFTVAITTSLGMPAVAAPLTTNQSIEVFQPEEAKTVAVGKELFSFKKLVNKDSDSTISIIDITYAPQSKGALLLEKHILQAPEDFYVLQGDFEFLPSQSDKKIKVTTGDMIHIPPGLPYGYEHIGAGQGRIMLISNSTGLQNLLKEIGTPVADKSSIPSTSPLDMEKVAAIARKYDIEFLN